jgi:ribonuclease-3
VSDAEISRLNAIQSAIEHEFRDLSLLRQSLVHRSWAHENATDLHNEPLEFLGDAVLGFLVAEEIYRSRRDLDEGGMTRLRAKLVNARHLASLASRLELGDALYLGRGEERSGGREKASLLANAFEAVTGAVFLDGGVRAARRLVKRLFADDIRSRAGAGRTRDPKTELQELAQARGWALPEYRVSEIVGPDHDRTFTVEVALDGEIVARGSGRSKKRAEQACASRALDELRGDDAP